MTTQTYDRVSGKKCVCQMPSDWHYSLLFKMGTGKPVRVVDHQRGVGGRVPTLTHCTDNGLSNNMQILQQPPRFVYPLTLLPPLPIFFIYLPLVLPAIVSLPRTGFSGHCYAASFFSSMISKCDRFNVLTGLYKRNKICCWN